MLPGDNHLHSEWSWDAPRGSMERTCAQAIALGVPSVAFTDHADFTAWVDRPRRRAPGQPTEGIAPIAAMFSPPPLDFDGYLAALDECRKRFPELRIVSGVELGEPHWHRREVAELLGSGAFERVLVSMHSAPGPDGRLVQIRDAYGFRRPSEVVRRYLDDARTMIESSDVGSVLAHVDYPARSWPAAAGSFDPGDFEEEFRAVFRSLARSGRALEVNTRLVPDVRLLRWWRAEGGELVSFGSDAHDPMMLARRFAMASAMVEDVGFRPGRDPHDLWYCARPT